MVDKIDLIENFLCLVKTDAMFLLDGSAFLLSNLNRIAGYNSCTIGRNAVEFANGYFRGGFCSNCGLSNR